MGFEPRNLFLSAASVFLIVVLVTMATSCEANSSLFCEKNLSSNVSAVFHDWMKVYGRVYATEAEKEKRFRIFNRTYHYVKNSGKSGEKRLYTLGLNNLADLTSEELDAMTCTAQDESASTTLNVWNLTEDIDPGNTWYMCDGNEGIDWSQKGYISPVRTQGKCGSCWAMAVAASLEAATRIKFNTTCPPLSVQQILDCTPYGNNRCNGGLIREAYNYIMQNGGMTSDDLYPYRASNGTCDNDLAGTIYGEMDGYRPVAPLESELAKAVCKQPVVATIAANTSSFFNYQGGIYHAECSSSNVHAVLVVGVGREEDGTEDGPATQYWKILNSWGPEWGEGGYMRLIKNGTKGGHCGIALHPYYPYIEY